MKICFLGLFFLYKNFSEKTKKISWFKFKSAQIASVKYKINGKYDVERQVNFHKKIGYIRLLP